MSGILQSAAWFIVALGVLVTIHEFGHFYVAKRLNVKILRFSVGFGKPLWRRRFGADGTEFVVAAVPLGGYVKMLDEREGPVDADQRHRAFNVQPLGYRFAIVLAGPVANFLLAILAYWVMFVVGVQGIKPLVGEVAPDSIAAQAGLKPNMEIVAVDGRATPTWEAVLHTSIGRILDSDSLALKVRGAGGQISALTLDLSDVRVDDVTKGNLFKKLGMQPYQPRVPAVIDEVLPGGAAEQAGLLPGDQVIGADGVPIESWDDWVRYVRARPEISIQAQVARQQQTLSITITPQRVVEDGDAFGRIGAALRRPAGLGEELLAVERYPPWDAVARAVGKTWDVAAMTLRILGKMLFGQASVENLSGPISIAQYAGQSASLGFNAFLAFLAIVSVSLGVLNLLPVPLLDGGHLLYYLVEFVIGKPVSESVQAVGQQVGLALLLGLMGLAFYNDIMRIL